VRRLDISSSLAHFARYADDPSPSHEPLGMGRASSASWATPPLDSILRLSRRHPTGGG
jgi:hypothetical protein